MLFILVPLLVCALGLAGCGPGTPAVGEGKLLSKGWENYRSGDFKKAIETFDQALIQAPAGSPEERQALYGLASTWNLRRPDADTERAAQYYQKLIDTHPQSEEAAWSLLALARIKDLRPVGEETDLAAARAAYQLVIDRFPAHPAGQEALLYQQSTYIATGKKEDARQVIDRLSRFLRDYPESNYLSTVYGLTSAGYDRLKQRDRQLEFAIKSLDAQQFDTLNPKRDNAVPYWSLATLCEFNLGDFAMARTFYQRLIREYPTDQRVFPAKMALERMDRIEAALRQNPNYKPQVNAP